MNGSQENARAVLMQVLTTPRPVLFPTKTACMRTAPGPQVPSRREREKRERALSFAYARYLTTNWIRPRDRWIRGRRRRREEARAKGRSVHYSIELPIFDKPTRLS